MSTNTAGAELRHDQIFKVALYNTDDRERFNTVRSDDVAETSLGAYLENETQWTGKSGRVKFAPSPACVGTCTVSMSAAASTPTLAPRPA